MINKKVLIIGGAGFIGHNLALYLKKKNFNIFFIKILTMKINNLTRGNTKLPTILEHILNFLNVFTQ